MTGTTTSYAVTSAAVPAEPVLSVRELAVRFRSGDETRQALDGLDVAVAPGQTVGLIGRSGSGKTTAGRAILGLLPRNATVSGAVRFGERDLLAMSEPERRRIRWEELALVPQAAMSSLDPVMAVDKQIAEVVRAHRDVRQRTAIGMAHAALERVGIHAERATAYPHQFSGGMRQRALIAMATVLEPAVLVADEPTTGLDVIVQDRILDLFVRAKEDLGLALLIVTHDLGVANELCDHVVELEHGRVCAAGAPAEVLSRPGRGRIDGSGPVGAATEPATLPGVPTGPARAALDVDGLTVTFNSGRGLAAMRRSNELTVLRDITLTVGAGEVVGLAGESGCGKSSLVSTLVGLTDVAGGTIRIAGRDVGGRQGTDWRPLRQHVQMVFQDPYDSLNPRLTVFDAVAEPLVAQGLARGEGAREERVAKAMDDAGLSLAQYGHRYPYELSGGERQRVAIARALVVEPRVLLADEPVSMLDEQTAAGVVELLEGLARRLGVAVLLVSHDVSLLSRVCDRVAVMYMGRIVEIGPPHQVLEAPQHPYAAALVRAVPSRVPGLRRERVLLMGEPPSLTSRPSGCAFHPRCPRSDAVCAREEPRLMRLDAPGADTAMDDGHGCACWHPISDSSRTTPEGADTG